MALLNRFSRLNDKGETGVFTFIVTKSVTRDLHRDATTKDFCFGYHRWAVSFQRPTDKQLGVHLLLRNASPNTACVVDFSLTLLNRQHFSQNQVYTKRAAKFTITNPMQGVSRWIQMSDLTERHFSNETGEFLFELSLSNMSTIFECDIQLTPSILAQYRSMLIAGNNGNANNNINTNNNTSAKKQSVEAAQQQQNRISLETNTFTFGAFDWSLTIVPLVVSTPASGSSSGPPVSPAQPNQPQPQQQHRASGGSGSHLLAGSGASSTPEPVCRVYLNRLNGFDALCRVKYRVILGHHQQPAGVNNQSSSQQVNCDSQQQQQQPCNFADSRKLDQISDANGRIRGHQFRHTNLLELITLRSGASSHPSSVAAVAAAMTGSGGAHHSRGQRASAAAAAASGGHSIGSGAGSGTRGDLRVHIEMFCANTVSEAMVQFNTSERKANDPQVANCSDRNKQNWCIESDTESGDTVRLKLFFMDLQSVPRNHIRYISWIAYLVRRDASSGAIRDSAAVRNAPHSNYYLQDGIDMGTIMETDVQVKELTKAPLTYLSDVNELTVHIEWVDSLLLFSHLYNNYDALATVQRHQMSRELCALQQEYDMLARDFEQQLALRKQSQSSLAATMDSGTSRGRSATGPGAPVHAPAAAAHRFTSAPAGGLDSSASACSQLEREHQRHLRHTRLSGRHSPLECSPSSGDGDGSAPDGVDSAAELAPQSDDSQAGVGVKSSSSALARATRRTGSGPAIDCFYESNVAAAPQSHVNRSPTPPLPLQQSVAALQSHGSAARSAVPLVVRHGSVAAAAPAPGPQQHSQPNLLAGAVNLSSNPTATQSSTPIISTTNQPQQQQQQRRRLPAQPVLASSAGLASDQQQDALWPPHPSVRASAHRNSMAATMTMRSQPAAGNDGGLICGPSSTVAALRNQAAPARRCSSAEHGGAASDNGTGTALAATNTCPADPMPVLRCSSMAANGSGHPFPAAADARHFASIVQCGDQYGAGDSAPTEQQRPHLPQQPSNCPQELDADQQRLFCAEPLSLAAFEQRQHQRPLSDISDAPHQFAVGQQRLQRRTLPITGTPNPLELSVAAVAIGSQPQPRPHPLDQYNSAQTTFYAGEQVAGSGPGQHPHQRLYQSRRQMSGHRLKTTDSHPFAIEPSPHQRPQPTNRRPNSTTCLPTISTAAAINTPATTNYADDLDLELELNLGDASPDLDDGQVRGIEGSIKSRAAFADQLAAQFGELAVTATAHHSPAAGALAAPLGRLYSAPTVVESGHHETANNNLYLSSASHRAGPNPMLANSLEPITMMVAADAAVGVESAGEAARMWNLAHRQ